MSCEIEYHLPLPNKYVAEESLRNIKEFRHAYCNPFLPSEDEGIDLTEVLRKISVTENGLIKLKLVEAILKESDSNDVFFDGRLEKMGHSLEELPNLLDKETLVSLLTLMVENVDLYRFQIGFALTMVNVVDLPIEVIEKLKPVWQTEKMKLFPEYKDWGICGTGESKFKKAMDEMAVVAINNVLLTKFNGKLTALCTQTTVSPEGYIFLEGCLYSPVEYTVTGKILDAFDEGVGTLLLPKSSWVYMRALRGTYRLSFEELVEQAKLTMEKCQEKQPELLNGLSREVYRYSSLSPS